VSFNDTDAQVRGEAGLTPDAVVLLLHLDEHEVRLVIVVPGVFAARLRGAAKAPDASPSPPDVSGEAENEDGEEAEVQAIPSAVSVPQLTTGPLGAALSKVPLDLALELGQARVPLAHILHLRDGEVLELRQAIDAPVDLVSESTAVARGDLEVSDAGNLVLVVTSIPGRPDAPTSPRVMGQRATDAPGDAGHTPAPDPLAPEAATPNPDAPLSDPDPALEPNDVPAGPAPAPPTAPAEPTPAETGPDASGSPGPDEPA
jgi:flagellar motor switch/type III secretory pathway protein FliN